MHLVGGAKFAFSSGFGGVGGVAWWNVWLLFPLFPFFCWGGCFLYWWSLWWFRLGGRSGWLSGWEELIRIPSQKGVRQLPMHQLVLVLVCLFLFVLCLFLFCSGWFINSVCSCWLLLMRRPVHQSCSFCACEAHEVRFPADIPGSRATHGCPAGSLCTDFKTDSQRPEPNAGRRKRRRMKKQEQGASFRLENWRRRFSGHRLWVQAVEGGLVLGGLLRVGFGWDGSFWDWLWLSWVWVGVG